MFTSAELISPDSFLPSAETPPTHEHPVEHNIAFKYDVSNILNADTEIAVYENSDGSSDIKRLTRPTVKSAYTVGQFATMDIAPFAPEDAQNNEHQWKAIRVLPSDMEEALVFPMMSKQGHAIFSAMGYNYRETSLAHQGKQLDVQLPSVNRANQFLDYVRSRTGFAVALEEFEGTEFSNALQHEKLSQTQPAVMISSRLGVHQHDLLVHALAWATVPKDFITIATKNYPNDKDLFRRADFRVDIQLFDAMTQMSTSPDLAKYVSKMFAYLLFNRGVKSTSEPDEAAAVENLQHQTIERVQALATAANEFNELAKVA